MSFFKFWNFIYLCCSGTWRSDYFCDQAR